MTTKIGVSLTGKIHRAVSTSATWCNAHNRGIAISHFLTAEQALKIDERMFCKKCFGDNPKGKITLAKHI